MQNEGTDFSDPREKRAHQPHPLIAAIAPLDALQTESDKWIGCGRWRPTSMRKVECDPGIFSWLQSGARNLFQIMLSRDQCAFFEVSKLIIRTPDDGSAHLLLAHSGDDISIKVEGSTEYCRVFKIFVVRFGGRFFGFLFPFWYKKENRTHRVTRNQLVTRTAVFERPDALCPPVAWADVMQQVLVAHSCSELCVVKCLRHDERRCKGNDCKHPSAHKVYHNQDVKLWEVVDRQGGFTTANVKASSKIRCKSVPENPSDYE
jgi:hypothetical protein